MVLKAELDLILDLFCLHMEGVDIVVKLVVLPDVQSILRKFLGPTMERYGTLVDLEEDGELIQGLLFAIGSEVGGHSFVVGRVVGVLVEIAIVK